MSQRKTTNAKAASTPAEKELDFGEAVAWMKEARDYYRARPHVNTDEATGESWMQPDLEDFLLEALRYAQAADGAPARCRRRECRHGRCHMRLAENGDGVCAGGVRPAAIDDAARMIGFLIDVFKRRVPAMFA